jgi:tetratricopeptide (TPR) repeat protein
MSAGEGMQGPDLNVRQARYQLALALLDEGPIRVAEAIEQLDLAVNELGEEPPAWKLLETGAEAVRDAKPTEAAARYLRSLRHRAPERVAQEARRWVESLLPGTVRLEGATIDGLLRQPTTPSNQLLAATLWRSLGDSARALATVRQVPASSEVRAPQLALQVQCLIDLADFDAAERLLADPVRAGALSSSTATFLGARLAYMRRDFDGALGLLDQLAGEETDEIITLRNLALTGAGRGAEVSWSPPDTEDRTGPETWLSRAVAALASGRYAEALEAASWAERSLPESLSILLVKAQAYLENDQLEQGLDLLDQVATAARDRDRCGYGASRWREPTAGSPTSSVNTSVS